MGKKDYPRNRFDCLPSFAHAPFFNDGRILFEFLGAWCFNGETALIPRFAQERRRHPVKPEQTPQELPGSPAAPVVEASCSPASAPGLARKLGLFDLTMLVMGTVIGCGIFRVPRDVASLAKSPDLVLAAWILGGVVSLAGSLVYAELTRRRPLVGGQYAFLREAYHPAIAFLYGWSLLWMMQSGGMAAVALVFAEYFIKLVHLFGDWLGGGGNFEVLASFLKEDAKTSFASTVVATVAIALLTIANCAGVRAGSTAQNIFMTLKILAIVLLVACGLAVADTQWSILGERAADYQVSAEGHPSALADSHVLIAFLAAMVPVFFAYGGSHTTTFMAGEVRDPAKTFPPALVLGVSGVMILYVAVNFVCLRVLGIQQLTQTKTPAFDVMWRALGPTGAAIISIGIAISALGFLSSATLTSPRVYYAMAKDGIFFQTIAWVHPRTRVPVVAILLQGLFAIVITLSGDFLDILKRIMTVELIFWSLTALSLFILRRRDGRTTEPASLWTRANPAAALLFAGVNVAVVLDLFWTERINSGVGILIALAGLPVYLFWHRRQSQAASSLK
jgi:APA family basic amino acid/polyamine antiporter